MKDRIFEILHLTWLKIIDFIFKVYLNMRKYPIDFISSCVATLVKRNMGKFLCSLVNMDPGNQVIISYRIAFNDEYIVVLANEAIMTVLSEVHKWCNQNLPFS